MNFNDLEKIRGTHQHTSTKNGVQATVTYTVESRLTSVRVDGVPVTLDCWRGRNSLECMKKPFNEAIHAEYISSDPTEIVLERISRVLRERFAVDLRTIQAIQAYDDNPDNWKCLVDRIAIQKEEYSRKQPLSDGDYLVAQSGEIFPVTVTTTKKGDRNYRSMLSLSTGKKVRPYGCSYVYVGKKLVL